MRRIQKQLGMLFVFLCTVILTGCNDEESNPLRFDQSVDEDNTVDVLHRTMRQCRRAENRHEVF